LVLKKDSFFGTPRKGNNYEVTAIFSEVLGTQRPAPKRSEQNVEGMEWSGGTGSDRDFQRSEKTWPLKADSAETQWNDWNNILFAIAPLLIL
jgi:hypothetical protein